MIGIEKPAMRCGLVSPFWVQLGWVTWAGTGQREKLMSIEYRQCTSTADAPTTIGKHAFPWCVAHAAEMTQPMTRTLLGDAELHSATEKGATPRE